MTKIKIVSIYVFLIIVLDCKGQPNFDLIIGKWIKFKVENINSDFHFNPYDPVNTIYFSYNFVDYNSILVAKSPYHKGKKVDYQIRDNVIRFNTQRLKINLISDSLLVLEEMGKSSDIRMQPRRYYFHSQAYAAQKFKESELPTIITDTIKLISNETMYDGGPHIGTATKRYQTNENFKPSPIFNGFENDFETYLRYKLKLLSLKGSPKLSVFSFVVTKEGKVEDVKINNGSDQSFNKSILKALNKSLNKWQEASIDNEVVSVKMIFPISIVEKPKINTDKLEKLKIKAHEHYSRGFLKDALSTSNEIIALDNLGFHFLIRAEILYQLKRNDEACADWMTVYKMGLYDSYEYLNLYCDF